MAGLTLFEIVPDLRALMERLEVIDPETGEVTEDPAVRRALDGLLPDFASRLEWRAQVAAEAKAEAEALGEVAKRVAARKKSAEAKAERMRRAIRELMVATSQPSVRSRLFTFSISPGRPRAEVEDLDALPPEFVKVTRTARLDDIKEALLANKSVPGAGLVDGDDVLTIR